MSPHLQETLRGYGFRKNETYSFPGGSDGTESACNAADPGLIPKLGRSPGEWNGSPSLYSCLENPMDRGAWRAIGQGLQRIGHN